MCMGTSESAEYPPSVLPVHEQAFFYTKADSRQSPRPFTLKQCVLAVLDGNKDFEKGGTWKKIIGGKFTPCDEPAAIKAAREFVEKHGIGLRPKYFMEWRPSERNGPTEGWLYWFEL